jgi:hypothetical protein
MLGMDANDPQLLRDIKAFLEPHLRDSNNRYATVEAALVGCHVLSQLSLDPGSSASVFTHRLVTKLSRYGRCENGDEALVMLLDYVGENNGTNVQREAQALIARVHQIVQHPAKIERPSKTRWFHPLDWFGDLSEKKKAVTTVLAALVTLLSLVLAALQVLPEQDRIGFLVGLGLFTPVPTQTVTVTPLPSPSPTMLTEGAAVVGATKTPTATLTAASPDAVLYRDFFNLAFCPNGGSNNMDGITLVLEGKNTRYSLKQASPTSQCICFQMADAHTEAHTGCNAPTIETSTSVDYRSADVSVRVGTQTLMTCSAQPNNREVYSCDVYLQP